MPYWIIVNLKIKVRKMPGSIAIMSDGKKNYVKPGHSSAE